jgi:hypothetical protein
MIAILAKESGDFRPAVKFRNRLEMIGSLHRNARAKTALTNALGRTSLTEAL